MRGHVFSVSFIFIAASNQLLNKIAHFRLDPRDERDDAAYNELVGDESGRPAA